jgi:von Willebrand factor type A C-terminal domain/von Willebrand factor type A domain
MDAVLTVTSSAGANASRAGGGVPLVLGFLLDISGSMSGAKLNAAKNALRRNVALLPESAHFFVAVFSESATAIVPICAATPANKEHASRMIQRVDVDGGTVMSTGLYLMKQMIERFGECIASVSFLTDGQNDPTDMRRLREAVEACKNVFQCDCRGVGTDWQPKELRMISEALLGNADAITDPAGLDADFQGFLERAMAKGIAYTRLRLWSPKVVKLMAVKQVSPEIVDISSHIVRPDGGQPEVSLGAWGNESRDYQLTFEVPAGVVGDEMMVCRPALLYMGSEGEVKIDCNHIVAGWSADEAQTTRINPEVAHYTGQEELASSIQEGLQAREAGDADKATRLLGRAAKLAAETGNEEVTKRLKKVVDVVDASSGTVRLKKADKAAELELEMGGTRTVRRRVGVSGTAGEQASG